MAWVPDKANICLRCDHGEVNAKGGTKEVICCTCKNSKVHGQNKGRRFNCKHYEPKKEE